MKFAWFLMVVGALLVFQGVAIVFVGINPPNLWIILCGLGIGIGLGYYPMYVGYKRRKEFLSKKV